MLTAIHIVFCFVPFEHSERNLAVVEAMLDQRHRGLGGGEMSLADLAAAAELSAIDYLGEVPWEEDAQAKDWYARVKSRPSFRPILSDLVRGNPPVPHYADLDF